MPSTTISGTSLYKCCSSTDYALARTGVGTIETNRYTAGGIAIQKILTGSYHPTGDYGVFQTFLTFDTSSIPAGSVITSASLTLFKSSVAKTDGNADFTYNFYATNSSSSFISLDNSTFTSANRVAYRGTDEDGLNQWITCNTDSKMLGGGVVTGGTTVFVSATTEDIASSPPLVTEGRFVDFFNERYPSGPLYDDFSPLLDVTYYEPDIGTSMNF